MEKVENNFSKIHKLAGGCGMEHYFFLLTNFPHAVLKFREVTSIFIGDSFSFIDPLISVSINVFLVATVGPF